MSDRENLFGSKEQTKLVTRNAKFLYKMLNKVRTPYHPNTNFIDPEVYKTLDLQITRLPFDMDEELDFDKRFTLPMAKEKFEAEFKDFFEIDGEVIRWKLAQEYDSGIYPTSVDQYNRAEDVALNMVHSSCSRKNDKRFLEDYVYWNPGSE
jgi:hypothetical protein